MLKLSGIFAAIPTPFDWDGNLYPAKVHFNVARWNRVVLSGYVVCGRAGESNELMLDDKLRMLSLVKADAAEGRVLIAGVGAESLRNGILISEKAAGMGYQAVLADPCGREATAGYYLALADRSSLPVIVTGADEATAIAASQHPNVAAVVAPGEIGVLKDKVRAGVQILTGHSATLARDLQAGATAALLPYAAAAPYSTITIWEATRTRDTAAAEDWQGRIATAVDLLENKYGASGLKHAMDLNGYYGGPPRLPLAPISTEAKAEIEAAFDGLRG
jgi:4-hydroxy-2-oxoglutarate aldolase